VGEKLTYSKLRDILREEDESELPIDIKDDFYINAIQLIKELEKKAKENPEIYSNEYLNAKSTFERLLEVRIRKILYMAYAKQPTNLTETEQELYDKIVSNIEQFKNIISQMQKADIQDKEIEKGKVKIRIKKFIPL